jgi:hypothetical protein
MSPKTKKKESKHYGLVFTAMEELYCIGCYSTVGKRGTFQKIVYSRKDAQRLPLGDCVAQTKTPPRAEICHLTVFYLYCRHFWPIKLVRFEFFPKTALLSFFIFGADLWRERAIVQQQLHKKPVWTVHVLVLELRIIYFALIMPLPLLVVSFPCVWHPFSCVE